MLNKRRDRTAERARHERTDGVLQQGVLTSGIMHSLVTHRVPYVLAGSIRDDGPLPGVYSDTLEAQDAMRELTVKATGAQTGGALGLVEHVLPAGAFVAELLAATADQAADMLSVHNTLSWRRDAGWLPAGLPAPAQEAPVAAPAP